MIYNLTVQEAYVILNGLKLIYNEKDINNIEVFNTYTKVVNSFDITKNELNNLTNKFLKINGIKIKWIESIEFKQKNIFVLFNKDIFNYFDNTFIDFIKSTNISFKYLGSYKLLELLFYNNKINLTLNDLYKLDCNTHLMLNNLDNEEIELKTKLDYEIDNNNILNIKRKILEIQEYKEIFKNKDIFDYCNLLKLFSNELINHNIMIKYKVIVKNDEYMITIKRILDNNKINHKEFKYIKEITKLKESIRQSKIKTLIKLNKKKAI